MSVENLATVIGVNLFKPQMEDAISMMKGTCICVHLLKVLLFVRSSSFSCEFLQYIPRPWFLDPDLFHLAQYAMTINHRHSPANIGGSFGSFGRDPSDPKGDDCDDPTPRAALSPLQGRHPLSSAN